MSGAPGNTIGGAAVGEGNVISGNDDNGVEIFGGAGSTATSNMVLGNIIGLDKTGAIDLGNTLDGVFVNGAPGNTIGGAAIGEGNVISGNNNNGVEIDGSAASGNIVVGNTIGLDKTGAIDLGNAFDGIDLTDAIMPQYPC